MITHTPIPTYTSSPTRTSTSTITTTSTPKLVPTITPTPTATPLGGGNGKILASCEGKYTAIYIYDLASGELGLVHPDYPRSDDHLILDAYLGISPEGDEVIWYKDELYDVEFGRRAGVDIIVGFGSSKMNMYRSGTDFKLNITPASNHPEVWLPGGLGIYVDRDEKSHKYNMIYLASIDREEQKLISMYAGYGLDNGKISPDGKYFAFATDKEFTPIEKTSYDNPIYITVIDLENHTHRDIHAPAFGGTLIIWSPDSTQLLFEGFSLHEEDGTYSPALYLLDIQSTEWKLLGEVLTGAWLPDGEHILIHDYGKGELYTIRTDGTRLEDFPLPDWWTKGQWYTRQTNELIVMPDGEGALIRAGISWSEDKHEILYYDFASKTLKAIFEYTASSFMGEAWIKLSPDGKWFILQTVVRFPGTTGYMDNFYVCSLSGCTQILPPETFRCLNADWVGPVINN